MMSMTRERVRRLASAAILAAALSTIAAAPAAAFGPACSTPPMTQAYSAWGDPGWYTLAPGQTAGDFNGDGWILLGGARIVSTQLDDGTTGHVLDLPAGSQAIGPLFSFDPTYRTSGHDAQRRRTGQRLAVLHLRWGRSAADSVCGGSTGTRPVARPLCQLDRRVATRRFQVVTGLGRGDLRSTTCTSTPAPGDRCPSCHFT